MVISSLLSFYIKVQSQAHVDRMGNNLNAWYLCSYKAVDDGI